MTQPVQHFKRLVTAALPRTTVRIDRPAKEIGHWFIDLNLDGHEVTAEWHPAHGFGVSSPALEAGYGEGPEEVFRDAEAAATRVVDLLRTHTRTRPPTAVRPPAPAKAVRLAAARA